MTVDKSFPPADQNRSSDILKKYVQQKIAGGRKITKPAQPDAATERTAKLAKREEIIRKVEAERKKPTKEEQLAHFQQVIENAGAMKAAKAAEEVAKMEKIIAAKQTPAIPAKKAAPLASPPQKGAPLRAEVVTPQTRGEGSTDFINRAVVKVNKDRTGLTAEKKKEVENSLKSMVTQAEELARSIEEKQKAVQQEVDTFKKEVGKLLTPPMASDRGGKVEKLRGPLEERIAALKAELESLSLEQIYITKRVTDSNGTKITKSVSTEDQGPGRFDYIANPLRGQPLPLHIQEGKQKMEKLLKALTDLQNICHHIIEQKIDGNPAEVKHVLENLKL